jgi:hypothetical protein
MVSHVVAIVAPVLLSRETWGEGRRIAIFLQGQLRHAQFIGSWRFLRGRG